MVWSIFRKNIQAQVAYACLSRTIWAVFKTSFGWLKASYYPIQYVGDSIPPDIKLLNITQQPWWMGIPLWQICPTVSLPNCPLPSLPHFSAEPYRLTHQLECPGMEKPSTGIFDDFGIIMMSDPIESGIHFFLDEFTTHVKIMNLCLPGLPHRNTSVHRGQQDVPGCLERWPLIIRKDDRPPVVGRYYHSKKKCQKNKRLLKEDVTVYDIFLERIYNNTTAQKVVCCQTWRCWSRSRIGTAITQPRHLFSNSIQKKTLAIKPSHGKWPVRWLVYDFNRSFP